ncbi:hypothetical protein SERLA73DRAFT_188471 [Serpula lacrymans var. lacrymans S7.3]|uniref:thioredoxin-dependent peroxiredoxin n=2 Tax=Serpula lacrymans var. lacrymans TaxID=341189 RepID=F8QBD6_SERL3|nr:uncharacterized protein SERLADRAFT_478592 [Serpula lacrymans var. lacrymans S7.9]EGN94522.1 hypothetical protein SERLA73DRAFT_188471 [Serpula lacrymans var. lacrymans S7.3]EGO20003.1 hypothetical protein SERLADRAFT_478592 [Serpula lacrymans var. lacrymans S7.9]
MEAPAPRRSSRISSKPKSESKVVPEKKKRTVKTGTKRGAEDQGSDDANKKAKADAGDSSDANQGQNSTAETAATPDIAQINIGDSLPSLTLKNEKDEDVDVTSIASEKGVVLFLVPKADTPGCTQQACGFRDIWGEFGALNFDVYCLSADTSAAQSKWQSKKELPYQLLSDPKRMLITALGAGDGNKTKRSHFIFEKGGKLVDKKMPVKPVDSPKLALEFIKSSN